MRRIVVLIPGAVGVVCAAYTGIYLVRWEWNRAIVAGLFFLAAEVIVVGMLVLERLRRTEERVAAALEAGARPPAPDPLSLTDPADPAVLDALRVSAPEPGDRFAWIRDQSGQMNVFLPVLLGAGVVASALAWVVERLARATVSPALERRLAARLGVLALPAGGLFGPPASASVRRPRPRWGARLVVAVLVVFAGAGTALAIDYVADRTQTRPDTMDPEAQTTIDLALHGAVAADDPDRAFHHLWAVCTGPDVFRLRELPAPMLSYRPDGIIRVVVDADVGEHGMERLRGCLNDATIDKVRARVVTATIG